MDQPNSEMDRIPPEQPVRTSESDSQLPSRKMRKKKFMWNNKLKYTILALLLAIVIIVIYYVYSIFNFASDIHKEPEDSFFGEVQNEDTEPPKWEGTDRVNILLLGGDARESEVPRSDSMIVVSIDPVTKKAHLFSILRDTYGKIPGYREDRINAALVLGGPQLAMTTVSELTGLEVQYYVYTDFQGFIALVDALGGIEFEVEKRMYYKDSHDDPIYHIDLKPGLQQLDGRTALAYVRFRHDALSDFTRTERQRNFLSAVAKKLVSTTSIIRLPVLLNSVSPFIETNLNVDDMLKLARLGFDIDTNEIASVQLPPSDLLYNRNVGGADVLGIRDLDKLKQYVQEQFIPPVEENEETGEAAGSENTTESNGTSNTGARQ